MLATAPFIPMALYPFNRPCFGIINNTGKLLFTIVCSEGDIQLQDQASVAICKITFSAHRKGGLLHEMSQQLFGVAVVVGSHFHIDVLVKVKPEPSLRRVLGS